MIWQTRPHGAPHLHDAAHSETVKPSWFGELIGHYEADGTLVIDTIGLPPTTAFLDGTARRISEKEHVVERFKLSRRRQRRSKRW